MAATDPVLPNNVPPSGPTTPSGSGGDSIISEVYFRIGGQLPRTIGGVGSSGSVLYYVQQALGIISGSATFMWDVQAVNINLSANQTVFDLGQLASPIDLGGHIEISNPNGIPITRVDDERLLDGRVSQYVTFNSNIFNQWFIVQSSSSAGTLRLKPALSQSMTIQMSYKMLPPTLIDGPSPNLRWTNPWMDALLIDFAEMEINRVLGFGGWQDLETRCQAKLQDARRMFTIQRKETGPPDEVDAGAKGE